MFRSSAPPPRTKDENNPTEFGRGRSAGGPRPKRIRREIRIWSRLRGGAIFAFHIGARGLRPYSNYREEGSALSSPFDAPTGNTLTEMLPSPSAACFQGPLPAGARQKAGTAPTPSCRPPNSRHIGPFPRTTSCPLKSSSPSEPTNLHLKRVDFGV